MDLSDLSINRSGDPTCNQFDSDHPHDINLICIEAGQHFGMVSRIGKEFFDGHFNVGIWFWELSQFPRKLLDRFAYYDEIWVATSFIASALSPISPVPVVVIPPVLTPMLVASRGDGRRDLALRPDEFAFLFIFDFHSSMERKNPLAVIDAFRKAFRRSEPARLIVKCVNGDSDPNGLAAMRARAEGAAIDIHDGYWQADRVRNLMAACDAYVSLHRCEGLGLTITDAMAMGKPVIATGWSGNMDFMSVANSFPTRYELVEIGRDVGPYRAGETWAEPSVTHAAELMRQVFEDRETAGRRGEVARRDIERIASESRVAALIQERLTLITHRDRLPAFRLALRSFFTAYRQLVERVREVVAASLPAGATVIVVSKGDETLVALVGRRGWHFPQDADGTFAGHHPRDSRTAVEHLEMLRERGGQYLLFPGTAFWWLDHYREFKEHLDTHHTLRWADEVCIIYQLSGSGAEDRQPQAPAMFPPDDRHAGSRWETCG
jgi:glycosyltransferase involved in cell wall biosynthesis